MIDEVPDHEDELAELELPEAVAQTAQAELPFVDSNPSYDRSTGFDISVNESQKDEPEIKSEDFTFEREFQEDILTGEMKLGPGGFPFTGEYPETKDPSKQFGIYMDIDLDLRYILEAFGRAKNRLTTIPYLIMAKDKEIYYWKSKYCQAAGLPRPRPEYDEKATRPPIPFAKDSVMIVATPEAQNWVKAAVILFFAGVLFAVFTLIWMMAKT